VDASFAHALLLLECHVEFRVCKPSAY
jgi:hypothetical protein